MSRISRQAILPLRIRVPLASFSPLPQKEVYENSFYLEAIQGISHYCNGRQYMTTIVTGQDEAEILNAVRSMSRSGKVDGFIILYSKKEDPVIDYLFNEGLLYILIGKATQYTNQTIYIDNDNLLAGEKRLNIFISLDTAGLPTLVPTVP